MKELEKDARSCYADEINMDRNNFLKMLLLDGCFILISLNGTARYMLELQDLNEANRETKPSIDENNATMVTNEELIQCEEKSQCVTCIGTARHEADEENSCSADLHYRLNFCHDLLLADNQIPFFILTKIDELLVVGGSGTTSMLVENVVECIEGVLGSYPNAIRQSKRPKNFFHLLHLCHMYFKPHLVETESCEDHLQLPLLHNFFRRLGGKLFNKFNKRSFPGDKQESQQASPWRRATQYHRAGIDFKKRTFYSENPHSLLDIAFCDGTMEVPCFTIDPNTYSLFCNLTAFEQTCTQFGCHVTAYIKFMSCLLTDAEDVLLLTKKGIILHQLNSDVEVSDLFRMISEPIVFDFNHDNYLKPLCNKIKAHYQSRRPMLKDVFSSITSNVYGWTQQSESSGLQVTTSQGLPL